MNNRKIIIGGGIVFLSLLVISAFIFQSLQKRVIVQKKATGEEYSCIGICYGDKANCDSICGAGKTCLAFAQTNANLTGICLYPPAQITPEPNKVLYRCCSLVPAATLTPTPTLSPTPIPTIDPLVTVTLTPTPSVTTTPAENPPTATPTPTITSPVSTPTLVCVDRCYFTQAICEWNHNPGNPATHPESRAGYSCQVSSGCSTENLVCPGTTTNPDNVNCWGYCQTVVVTTTLTPIPTSTTGPVATATGGVPPTATTAVSACLQKTRGDANCDGIINITDFFRWRNEFLQISAEKTADFDTDGVVNINDFFVWRRGFLSN